MTFPEPAEPAASRAAVLVRYLDFFREAVLAKTEGLTEEQMTGSILPSGWSPAELIPHLTHVVMGWLEWGFEGRTVDHPWGDQEQGRWRAPMIPAAEIRDGLRARGEVSREIIARHDLDEAGAPSERWDGAEPATLERVLLHLVQEYARHAGHLDIVRELLDGRTGES